MVEEIAEVSVEDKLSVVIETEDTASTVGINNIEVAAGNTFDTGVKTLVGDKTVERLELDPHAIKNKILKQTNIYPIKDEFFTFTLSEGCL